MAMEALIAVVGTIGAALWKFIKELPEIRRGSRKSLQEEFAFAEALIPKLNDETLHPFVRERGLQALVGSRTVKGDDIAYVLSRSENTRLLAAFMGGRRYLVSRSAADDVRFCFPSYLEPVLHRTVLKTALFAAYLIFFCAPVFYILFMVGKHDMAGIGEGVLFLCSCWSAAFLAANASIGIGCAEQVMSAQATWLQRSSVEIGGIGIDSVQQVG